MGWKLRRRETYLTVIWIFLFLACILTLLLLLIFANYGYDFTDEGFYLNWIAQPQHFSVSISQFGFVYHPLYILLNGNIVLLRQFNILLTYFLALVLFLNLLYLPYYNQIFCSPLERYGRIVLSSVFAMSSFLAFHLWLPTPSYNSLNLQGMLIVGISILQLERRSSTTYGDLQKWALLGIGGVICFMAKISTSGILAIFAVFYFCLTQRKNIRGILFSAFIAILGVLSMAYAIDGSISNFYLRILHGVREGGLLGGGHTISGILRLDRLSLDLNEILVLFCLSISLFFIFSIRWVYSKIYFLVALTSLYIFSLALLFFIKDSSFLGLQLFSVPLGIFLFVFMYHRDIAFQKIGKILVLLIFGLFPYAYAFGTNNNYWFAITGALIFWLMASLLLLPFFIEPKTIFGYLLPIAVVVQVTTGVVLFHGISTPYRQTSPLWSATEQTYIHGGRLFLNESAKAYIDRFRAISGEGTSKNESSLLDLTGRFPGLAYALNLRSLARPWMIGGYPGSQTVMALALRRVHCNDIGRALILLEPDGPRSIPRSIVGSVNKDISKDFEILARFESFQQADESVFDQILARIRPETLERLEVSKGCIGDDL